MHFQCSVISLLLVLITSVHAQPDFLSIDCGSISNFTDNRTTIQWVGDGDHRYISTGVTHLMSPNATLNARQELLTLRYFPDNQTKHCYTLPVTRGEAYLVRAGFLHGNYTGNYTLNGSLPQFHLFFEATYWTTVSFSKYNESVSYEMIAAATSNFFSLCVARNGTGGDDPFISSLEIRGIPRQSAYVPVHNSKFLYKYLRINFGMNTSNEVRYPDDPYDRIWYPDSQMIGNIDLYKAISTTNNVSTDLSADRPPGKVMMTARETNRSTDMRFQFNLNLGSGSYYFALFFAELEPFNSTENRAFNISLNQIAYYHNISISEKAGFRNSLEVLGQPNISSFQLQLRSTEQSTHGPILNAAELYLVLGVNNRTYANDVQVLEDIKSAFNLSRFSGDPCLPSSLYSWQWVECNKDTQPRIIALKLSNMSLQTTIPSSIANLTELISIDLQNNKLIGNIPSSFSNLRKLEYMWLQNNNLSGVVPEGLQNKTNTSGNSNMCIPYGNTNCNVSLASIPGPSPSPAPALDQVQTEPANSLNQVVLIVGLVVGSGLMIIMAALGVFLYRGKRLKRRELRFENSVQWPPVSSLAGAAQVMASGIGIGKETFAGIQRYSSSELETITKDFETQLEDSYVGKTFHGLLLDGQEVVVQVLESKFHQEKKEFINQVVLLARARHKNILSLSGFCVESDKQMLMYEYVSKGSYRDHLYERNMSCVLDWKTRLSIVVQAAQGIEYLHTMLVPSCIDGAVNSKNILLSEKMVPKVANYGLSRLLHGGFSSIVDGTSGYLDPEYFSTNQLTEKSDVYSFGVVLLETIFAREPIDTNLPREQWLLTDWVWPLLQDCTFWNYIDPALEGHYNHDAMVKVSQVAFQCIQSDSSKRPDMSKVVAELKEAVKSETGYHVAFVESVLPPSPASQDLDLPLIHSDTVTK